MPVQRDPDDDEPECGRFQRARHLMPHEGDPVAEHCEDCFVLKIHLAAISELDHLLDQLLAYGQTTTSLVQSTPVAPRLLPLPDERGRGK